MRSKGKNTDEAIIGPKFDPKTIQKEKITIRELIQAMQDYGLTQDEIAELAGYSCGNVIAQQKIKPGAKGYRKPGTNHLGTYFRLSGGKLDLSLYLK